MGEQDILRQIREKDEDAISKLYLDVKSSFVKYIKKYSGLKADEAEEIYQEAFYIMYSKIREGGLSMMIPDLPKYLFGIGRNLVSNAYKLHQKMVGDIYDGANLPIDSFNEVREQFENDSKQDIVRKAVQLLTEPCKSILSKFYWDELSYSEILTLVPNFSNTDALKAQKYKCMQRVSKTIKEMFRIADLD